jgi:hypothetical protein
MIYIALCVPCQRTLTSEPARSTCQPDSSLCRGAPAPAAGVVAGLS